MQCAQHPSESALGVCAPCLRERLTDLIRLQQHHNRSQVPFSAPLSLPSPPPNHTDADRIRRTQSVVKTNDGRTAQFTEKRPQGGKMYPGGGSNPSAEKKENREERTKARATPWWIAALLPLRRRKKSHMPAPPAAAAQSTKNLSFLSARSSSEERSGNDADFVGRDDAFHEQLKNSGTVTFEFEDYFSDSDLKKQRRGGGHREKASGGILSGRKGKKESRGASSSVTGRVNIFCESEEEESNRASPHVNPKAYFSGVFPSPSCKAKGKYSNHPDCAGSFSPYTDRKFQSSKPFSMARREDSGFAFCPSPRKFFSHEISRSPRRGGKLSNFFFSPARRTT